MHLTARFAAAAAVVACLAGSPAHAAGCQKEPNFDAWLKGVAQDAAKAGVSQKAIQAGLGVVHFDQGIVNKDRAQGVFSQTFLQFSDRMVEQYRVKQGPGQIKKYAKTFQKIEQTYGVPAEVIVAFRETVRYPRDWAVDLNLAAHVTRRVVFESLYEARAR